MLESKLKITYLGHATTLIELGKQAFLTDPNFSNKIRLTHHRLHAPGRTPEHLPHLDALLVSHACYDHLDVFSYKYFKSTTPIIVPKGLGKFVRKFLPHPVTEIPIGGQHRQRQTTIHATPVQKKGFRLLPLRYRAAVGYVLTSDAGNVYFAGDTAYGDHFKKTAEQFKIDVALLPVRLEKSKKPNPKATLNPTQALQAFEDLKAKQMIPIRWDAFQVSEKEVEALSKKLQEQAQKLGLASQLHYLQPGQALTLEESRIPSPNPQP